MVCLPVYTGTVVHTCGVSASLSAGAWVPVVCRAAALFVAAILLIEPEKFAAALMAVAGFFLVFGSAAVLDSVPRSLGCGPLLEISDRVSSTTIAARERAGGILPVWSTLDRVFCYYDKAADGECLTRYHTALVCLFLDLCTGYSQISPRNLGQPSGETRAEMQRVK